MRQSILRRIPGLIAAIALAAFAAPGCKKDEASEAPKSPAHAHGSPEAEPARALGDPAADLHVELSITGMT